MPSLVCNAGSPDGALVSLPRTTLSSARRMAAAAGRSTRKRLRSIYSIIAADAFLLTDGARGRLARHESVSAQDKGTKLPGEDWVQLFNGKDLTGWVEVGKEKWEVQEGVINGRAVTKEYGYLKTAKSYKDFQLSLKFKCIGDGNSGVFFHVDFKPGTADVSQGLAV